MLIPGNLSLRRIVSLDELVVLVIDLNGFGAVGILDHDIGIIADYQSLAVATPVGAGDEVGDLAVLVLNRDGLVHVHAGLSHDDAGIGLGEVASEIHPHEIDAVNAEIEQRASAEVGAKDTLLLLHGIAQAGIEHARLAEPAAVEYLLDLE